MDTSRNNMLFAAAIVASLTLAACGSEPWQEPGPDGAMRAFLLDWFMYRTESAHARLSPDDRGALERARATLVARVGEDAAPPVHEMLVGSAVASPYDLKKIEVLDAPDGEPEVGQRVKLKLEYLDGRSAGAVVLWGGDGWYVELGLKDALGTTPAPESSETESK